MKLTRTLLAAVAVSAFAVPAAAQDPVAPTAPATTPPAAPATAPPAEQPMMQPAPAQPGPVTGTAQQPTTQAAPAAPAQSAVAVTAPVPATPADLVVGAPVLDQRGQPVGTILEADAAGAVVNTGNARGRMNLDAFYKNERGLLIGYTRAEFEGLVSGVGGPETPDAEENATPAAQPEAPE